MKEMNYKTVYKEGIGEFGCNLRIRRRGFLLHEAVTTVFWGTASFPDSKPYDIRDRRVPYVIGLFL